MTDVAVTNNSGSDVAGLRSDVTATRIEVGEIKGMLGQALGDHARRIKNTEDVQATQAAKISEAQTQHSVLALRVTRLEERAASMFTKSVQVASPFVAAAGVAYAIWGRH